MPEDADFDAFARELYLAELKARLLAFGKALGMHSEDAAARLFTRYESFPSYVPWKRDYVRDLTRAGGGGPTDVGPTTTPSTSPSSSSAYGVATSPSQPTGQQTASPFDVTVLRKQLLDGTLPKEVYRNLCRYSEKQFPSGMFKARNGQNYLNKTAPWSDEQLKNAAEGRF